MDKNYPDNPAEWGAFELETALKKYFRKKYRGGEVDRLVNIVYEDDKVYLFAKYESIPYSFLSILYGFCRMEHYDMCYCSQLGIPCIKLCFNKERDKACKARTKGYAN